ncbi:MAG: carboxylate--amine ligase [Brachybacterium sp.]|nr:carboxylate--amine ligase [Brachybacterium sp.]
MTSTPPPPTPEFSLVLLGGDIGIYAIARAFHEQYGTHATAVTRQVAGPIADSRFIETVELGKDADDDRIVEALLEVGARASRGGTRPVILLANADWLVALMSAHRDRLGAHYVLPILAEQTLRDVSDKATFSEICAAIDVETPETVVLDFRGEGPTVIPELSFDFPVVAKAASSSAYSRVSFPGKRKVFEIASAAALSDLVGRLDAAGFQDRFVVQEMIPGDDTAMRSITAFVDSRGEVTLLGGAHVLLEEHTPGALGNPAAMFTTSLPDIEEQAVRFLQHTGYRGYANFDVKVDPRTGVAKFFEVNPRIGRNNYYMTAAGANIARVVVADAVEDRPIERLVPDREVLYSIVPRSLLWRYILDPVLKHRVRQIGKRSTVHPLLYRGEGLKRRGYVLAAMANQVRKFLRHYPKPSYDGF